jgi:hypothetical protein
MREIRQSGSEGGAERSSVPTPYLGYPGRDPPSGGFLRDAVRVSSA